MIRCINIELLLMITYYWLIDLWMIRYIMNVMTDAEALLMNILISPSWVGYKMYRSLLEERYEKF